MRYLTSPFSRSSLMRPIEQEIDKMFNNFFGKDLLPTLEKHAYPKCNVYKKEGYIHIDAYVPDISKDKLKLEMNEDILTISGESHQDHDVKDADYLYREISKRAFSRSFRLSDVDLSKIDAEHSDGILKIKVPMTADQGSPTKLIDIK